MAYPYIPGRSYRPPRQQQPSRQQPVVGANWPHNINTPGVHTFQQPYERYDDEEFRRRRRVF